MLENIEYLGIIISAFAATFGLLINARQLKLNRHLSRAQFIHELEVDAQRFQEQFHKLLLDYNKGKSINESLKHNTDEKIHMELNYLKMVNFFEKLDLIVEEKGVTLKQLDDIFSGRFFLLAHSEEVQNLILLNSIYEPHLERFKNVYKALYKLRTNNGSEIIGKKYSIKKWLLK